MPLAKVLLVSGSPPVFIEAQFNPKELGQTFTGHIQPQAGGNPEHLEMTGPAESELKLTLFFDGLESATDVRATYVRRLSALVDTGDETPKPVLVVWKVVLFMGAIVALDVKYTMFLPDGSPCRAEVGVTMRRGHRIEGPRDRRQRRPRQEAAGEDCCEWARRRGRIF